MKTLFSKSIQYGIIAGVILVFCELINLTSTFAVILEKLFGSAKSGSTASPLAIQFATGLVVFFIAFTFLRKKNGIKPFNAGQEIGSSILTGITTGAIISLLNVILGSYLDKGQDIRNYLDAMSPEVIRSFLLQTNIPNAVFQYFIAAILGGLAASLLHLISQKSNLSGRISKAVRGSAQKNRIQAFLHKYPFVTTILILLVVVAVFLLPVLVNAYTISVLGIVFIYAIMGLGLNLIVGLSGQLVFGYVAFYALGAYTFGLLTAPKPFGIEMNFWPALIVSIVIAAVGA